MPLSRVRVAPSRLSSTALARARNALGRALSDEPEDRIRHAHGQSYPELVRIRRGEIRNPPDLVATPRSANVALEALRLARELDLGVLPFGGGTSVTGGVEGSARPHLVLSTRALRRVLEVDRTSRTARVEAGLLGPELEAGLAAHGLALGHYPESFEHSTVGGWIATRSAGHRSTGRGKIEDLVLGLRLVAPIGELVVPTRPGASECPDLREVVLGSEGWFGVVTEATLALEAVPAERRYEAWLLPSFLDGIEALRCLLQEGTPPDTVRLSDEVETPLLGLLRTPAAGLRRVAEAALRRLRGFPGHGCLLVVGYEGGAAEVARRRRAVARTLHQGGAAYVGRGPGEAWYRERFELPYLRDELVDHGLLVESVETATVWSAVPALYRAVGDAIPAALAGASEPLVLCHLSHGYTTGASLYFTIVAPAGAEPEERWWALKHAATETIAARGAALSHHHGIGAYHREWYERQLGEAGRAVVSALRGELDPDGVMEGPRTWSRPTAP